jgi:hypothetical protein
MPPRDHLGQNRVLRLEQGGFDLQGVGEDGIH